MDEIQLIVDGNLEALNRFIIDAEKMFTFPQLQEKNRRELLWNGIFKFLQNPKCPNVVDYLKAIRMLSRDSSKINEIITQEKLEILLNHADLNDTFPTSHDSNSSDQLGTNLSIDQTAARDYEKILEAIKCLCNIFFNSTTAQRFCSKLNAVDGLIARLRTYKDSNIPDTVRFFDMKLLFLITALNTDTRVYLRNELHGLVYMTESLQLILSEAVEKNNGENRRSGMICLTDMQISFCCEILKVLFNVILKGYDEIDETQEQQFRRLLTVLQSLVLSISSTDVQPETKKISEKDEKENELLGHVVNLLTSVPTRCLNELIPSISCGAEISKEMEYDGHNMEFVYELVEFLRCKLERTTNVYAQQETLGPILSVLTRLSREFRPIRKYLRQTVLPPLEDVHNRPEDGKTLRNLLCKLLTTPITQIRDLAADFLFVLCKESVARMIKYTGYGNAAGLFATRGLLNVCSITSDSKYSSDSDDSDTEIYKNYKHAINPVVGCYEKPHPNPMEGMTEEQIEYESMKLVNLMDKLIRSDGIKPCAIGADGKPKPVEHILQLQRELNKPKSRAICDQDSDSD